MLGLDLSGYCIALHTSPGIIKRRLDWANNDAIIN